MGFSLVGNSGDTSQTTNNYTLSASLNPQEDFTGASGGVLGVTIAPLSQQGSTGSIDSNIEDYYAPVAITSVGSALGDSAVKALSAISTAQDALRVQIRPFLQRIPGRV